MITYDWAYLCSDSQRLTLTLRLLPQDKPFKGLRTMHLCYASHLDGRVDHTLMNVAINHAPRWLDFVTTDVSMLRWRLPDELQVYWNTGKARWSLGMKLLIPFLFDHRAYLYTDDDVIVPNDPASLLTTGSWGSKGCFRFAGRKLDIVHQLAEAFDTPDYMNIAGRSISENYDWHALDAGIWFMRDRANWSERLMRFAALPYVQNLTTRNLELRCLDQRFLTMFGLEHNWRPQSIGLGFAPPKIIRPNFFDKKFFFHYKSSSKARWMTLLEEHVTCRSR